MFWVNFFNVLRTLRGETHGKASKNHSLRKTVKIRDFDAANLKDLHASFFVLQKTEGF
ncbi:hypothetical protein LLG07_04965 [bacterium]|nr:hypothetical protein [bacterium]